MMPVTAVPMTKLSVYFLLSLLRDDPTVSFPLENRKHHWAYKGVQGPDHWPNSYPLCAGKNQSPIDIHTSACEYDPTLIDFSLTNFNQLSTVAGLGCQLNLTNNGHVATVAVSGDMSIEGGGLTGRYKTVEFHFHWGSTDDVGSEHAVDGAKFPLEMHVVNYAEKYETFSEAMSHPDGLAVLAVFFQVTEQDNPDFAPLAQTLQYLHKAGEHRLVDGVRLASLLPGDTSRYWRYQGSLTTPSCYQSVTWTVFRDPQKVSARQLRELRSLLHEDGHESADRQHAASGSANSNAPSHLVDNWRPLQPLNGRQVKRSFQDAPAPPTTQPAQTIAVTTYQSIREISQFPTVTTNQPQSSGESGQLVASVKPPPLTGELEFSSQTMMPSLQSRSQLFTTTFIPLRFTASLLQPTFSSPSLTTLRASSPAGSDTSGNGIYVLVRDFPHEANSTRSSSRPPLSSLDTSLDRLAELNPASVLLSGANTVQESKQSKDSQSTSSTNQLGSFDTSRLIQTGTVSESNNKLRSKFLTSTGGTSANNNKLQSDFSTSTVGTSASNNKRRSKFSISTVGTSASNNKLQSDFSISTIGTSASNNKLQSDFSINTVGTSASHNKLRSKFSTSTIGTSASNNKLQSDFSTSTVGTSASNNKLQSDFSTSTVGTSASNSKLQSKFSISTVRTSASNNKLQSDFSTSTVGTSASNNKLQSDFSTSTVGTSVSNNKLQSDFSTSTVGTSASNNKLQSDFSTSTVGTSASNSKLQSDFSTNTAGASRSYKSEQSALFGVTYTLVPFSGSLGTSTRVQNSGRLTLPVPSVMTSRPTEMTPLGGSLSPLQLVLQQLRQSGSQNTRSQSNFLFHPSLRSESSPKIIMPDGTRMSVNNLHQGPGQRQYPIFPPATGRFIQPLATQTNTILTQSSRSWNENIAERGLQSLRSSLYYSPNAASAGVSPMVERYSGQIYPEYSLYPVVAGDGGVDTPFVFLHGYNQPVRIRRLLYDRLYGSQPTYFNQ